MNEYAANYMKMKKMCHANKVARINKDIVLDKIKNIIPKNCLDLLDVNVYGQEEPLSAFMIEVISYKDPKALLKKGNFDLTEINKKLSNEFLINPENIFFIVATNDKKISEVLKNHGATMIKGRDEIKDFNIEDEEAVDNFNNNVDKSKIDNLEKEISLTINNIPTIGNNFKKKEKSFEEGIKDLVDLLEEGDATEYIKEKVLEKLTEALFWYEYSK